MSLQHNIPHKVINASKIWWGLEDVGYFRISPNNKKTIGYTENKDDAIECFSTKQNDTCPSKCRKVQNGCIPTDKTTEWVSIGSKINSKLDGSVYTVKLFLQLQLKSIPLLEDETKKNAIIVFPSGTVLSKKVFPFNTYKCFIKSILKLLQNYDTLILGGHSMGCALAQMFAIDMVDLIDKVLLQKIYVIGSGCYQWMNQEIITKFHSNFDDRFLFFGLKSDEQKFDPFLKKQVDTEVSAIDTLILSLSNTGFEFSTIPQATEVTDTKDIHEWVKYRQAIKMFLDTIKLGGHRRAYHPRRLTNGGGKKTSRLIDREKTVIVIHSSVFEYINTIAPEDLNAIVIVVIGDISIEQHKQIGIFTQAGATIFTILGNAYHNMKYENKSPTKPELDLITAYELSPYYILTLFDDKLVISNSNKNNNTNNMMLPYIDLNEVISASDKSATTILNRQNVSIDAYDAQLICLLLSNNYTTSEKHIQIPFLNKKIYWIWMNDNNAYIASSNDNLKYQLHLVNVIGYDLSVVSFLSEMFEFEANIFSTKELASINENILKTRLEDGASTVSDSDVGNMKDLEGLNIQEGKPPIGGCKTPAPKPSANRVVVHGKSRVVYLGPRGGRYIKRGGKFVRI